MSVNTQGSEITGIAPMMAELWRGPLVESHHRGRAVVVTADGRVLASWGCPQAPIYPRSAIKALQALPLLETGAFDHFSLSEPELALACASHHGEARHLRIAARWLDTVGCRLDDLSCGPHTPFDELAAVTLARNGQPATALHNNCSGKHLGMLTTARHCGNPLAGYLHPDHPVQRRITTTLTEMAGVESGRLVVAIDGCGVPTPALPLRALATAMARLADPTGLPPARVAAITRIRSAWRRFPGLIGGRTSFDTQLMLATRGAILVKSGAEGVVVAVAPAHKLGLALKIDDGAPRAKNVALMAVLRHLGLFGADEPNPVAATPIITNWAGTTVGVIRPAAGWLSHTHERE